MINVSVIIPTYNGRYLLEKNLPSVLAALHRGDELIVIDDASTDDSVDWLKFLSTTSQDIAIKILVNKTNLRFAASCNRGAKVATNPILVLLNNDVSPSPDFVAPLLKHFADKTVFAIGCKERATAEHGTEYGRAEAEFRRGFYVHWRSQDQDGTDTAWVAGGSGAFRHSMWEALGGFDVDFKPAYGEDIDLSFRAKKKGWKILFEPQSVVYHNHESTNLSVFGRQSIEIMSFKNAFLFMWKTAPNIERFKHFLWLPYHLILTTIRTKGTFLIGLIQALKTIIAHT